MNTFATPDGTKKYAARFALRAAKGHFREQHGLLLSSIGAGTYLGEADARTDQAYTEAIVAAVESGAVGGSARHHLHDQQAVASGQSHLFRKFRGDRNRAHAQSRTPYPPQSDQIIQHRFRRVHRNGKADSGALPDVRCDHGVDPDDLAVPIEQRPARAGTA